MAVCKVCGNDYDKSFTVRDYRGEEHVFDSFECAMHDLAPSCIQCGTKVIGHGVEEDGDIYCCANCARTAGKSALTDRHDTGAGSEAAI